MKKAVGHFTAARSAPSRAVSQQDSWVRCVVELANLRLSSPTRGVPDHEEQPARRPDCEQQGDQDQ